MTPDFSTSLSRLRTEFEDLVKDLRPELHRYCARIVGSAVDAEDVVQEALAKAFYSLPTTTVTNMRGWLFRIAHNKAVDHLRLPAERWDETEPSAEDDVPMEKTELLSLAFSVFLRLTVKQRCCVVLKDVLGQSLAEIGDLLGASSAEVKASLHRGRARLRELAAQGGEPPPVFDPRELELLDRYVDRFNARDFEAVRAMLADDVRLDLVNRSQRRGGEVALYFTRYAEFPQWLFAPGLVENRLAVLIYDRGAPETAHSFILLDWQGDRVSLIRDYLFVPYVLRDAGAVRLERGGRK